MRWSSSEPGPSFNTRTETNKSWSILFFKDLSFIAQRKAWDPFGLAGRWVYFISVSPTEPVPWWALILSWQNSDCKGGSCFCISAKFKMKFCLFLHRKPSAVEDVLLARVPLKNMRGKKQENALALQERVLYCSGRKY